MNRLNQLLNLYASGNINMSELMELVDIFIELQNKDKANGKVKP